MNAPETSRENATGRGGAAEVSWIGRTSTSLKWRLDKISFSAAPTLPVAFLLSFSLLACNSAKREAASLVAAVDGFRRADNGAKVERAKAVVATTCTNQEVCDAREACVATSAPMAKGLALKSEVESALADLTAQKITQEQALALGLPAKLDEATRLLDDAHGNLPLCDAKITALRLKYGL